MRLMMMMKTLCIGSYDGKYNSDTGFIDVHKHGNDRSADTIDFEDNDESTVYINSFRIGFLAVL